VRWVQSGNMLPFLEERNFNRDVLSFLEGRGFNPAVPVSLLKGL